MNEEKSYADAIRLRSEYGWDVPMSVVLTDDSDLPNKCTASVGDTLSVVSPPPDVETDDCSVFVRLPFPSGFVVYRMFCFEVGLE